MGYELDRKGRMVMIRKMVLILIMGMVLIAAATAATPPPVLLAMGCLIVFAFFHTRYGEQQG